MDSKLIFLVLACFIGKSAGVFRCYACGFSSVDTDTSCLEITNTTHTVNCRYQYCTIVRQEFIDPSGVVSSFVRGCEDAPIYLNHEVVDSTFRTFFRACTTDLCNIGNGVQRIGGGTISANPSNPGPNLLVPGTGSATTRQINLLLLFVVNFAVYLVCL